MKGYNWWEDPKNAEEVKRISWWEHPENKTTVEIPVSIVSDGKYWCVGTNKDTERLIGEVPISSKGESREDAVSSFFSILKFHLMFEEQCRLSYQRFVPFRKGPWGHIGGNWFAIFGIHVSFRYGKNMKGGWYIPFTKLNISVHNDWSVYRNWKNKLNSEPTVQECDARDGDQGTKAGNKK
jgi:hypothetical protein